MATENFTTKPSALVTMLTMLVPFVEWSGRQLG
ncbi:hypothetical protein CCHR01_00186 [Colletotrichum chrysophilum]|uniref:Uncharacterized protein n=1 Tax=Colletotrichum chrysophilum TaxID=1836956 RepID=A0AAD9B089_9PEZI|nr:hypothetical protein CCHR01_00186 [Colletotrichum chrysophilum]